MAAEINIRDFVASLYNSTSWKQRVDHMPDAQVFAIYKKEMKKLERAADKHEEPEPEDIGF